MAVAFPTDVHDEPLPTGAVALGSLYTVMGVIGAFGAARSGAIALSSAFELFRFGDLLGSSLVTYHQLCAVELGIQSVSGAILAALTVAGAIQLFQGSRTHLLVFAALGWMVHHLLLGLAEIGLLLAMPPALLAQTHGGAMGLLASLCMLGVWSALGLLGVSLHVRLTR